MTVRKIGAIGAPNSKQKDLFQMQRSNMFRSTALGTFIVAGAMALASSALAGNVTIDLGNVVVDQSQTGTTTQHAVAAAVAVGNTAGSTNSSEAINGLNLNTLTENVQQVTAPTTTDTGSFQASADGATSLSGALAANGNGKNPGAVAANVSAAASFGESASGNYAVQPPTLSMAVANANLTQALTNTVDQKAISIAGTGGLSGGANNTAEGINLANEGSETVNVHQ